MGVELPDLVYTQVIITVNVQWICVFLNVLEYG